MRITRISPRSLVSFLLVISLHLTFGQSSPSFELQDGDRVLFLGDTLLEREGNYGYLETALHRRYADRRFTVRNLSYSADTPRGISRSVFDPVDKGWERLKEQIAMVNPTVVFLGYGMASSLDFVGSPTDRMAEPKRSTDEKVARFRKEILELMDYIQANAATSMASASARSGSGVNDRASLSGTAVRGTPTPAEASAAGTPAEAAIASTKPAPRDPGGARPSAGSAVRFVILSPLRHEDLRAKVNASLPDPTEHNQTLAAIDQTLATIAQERGATFISLQQRPIGDGASPATTNGIHLSEAGYVAFADLVTNALKSAAQQASPVGANNALRNAILRKNELFFHRWRPQNQTYLFGFRKHEQGQNAKEIPMFDPLIDQGEAEIDRIKRGGDGQRAAASVSTPAAPAADVPPLPAPKFDVLDGYEITLWATNPLLEKPIQMNWDAQGRLWVASSRTYPQIAPGAQQEDRILILEDTDRDGKAEKSVVFSEGLLIPTGVIPDAPVDASGKNQASYVAASTELLRMTDTDGDGRADAKEIVLSGFGTEDTHHILHTLRWGPDGRLYFNQSIYIHSHIETPWGVVRQNSGGVMAFDPRSQRVEVMYNGFWNPWGTAWDKWGQAFITDGAGFQGISWGIRGAAYQTYEGSRRLLQSISPGSYPKFAGLELVYSPHFPEDWQGSAVTCDFRAHRVVHFGIQDLATESAEKKTPVTSGYVTKELPDIVRTNDVSFRPIDVKIGPDGALYIADWSNPVINHGEVDFRDPRRNRTHGRIWRVTKKGAPLVDWKPALSKTPTEILADISSPALWTSSWARQTFSNVWFADPNRRLPRTNPESTRDLLRNWRATVTNENDRVAMAFLMEALGGHSTDELVELTRSANPSTQALGARLLARVLAPTQEMLRRIEEKKVTFTTEVPPEAAAAATEIAKGGLEQLVEQTRPVFDQLTESPNPRVRIEVIRARAKMGRLEDADAVLRAALKNPENDPFYDYARWLSINDVAEPWGKAVLSGAWKVDSPERETQLQLALSAIRPEQAGEVLGKIIAERGLPKDGSGPWIELIGKSGGPKELSLLYRALLAGIEMDGDSVTYGAENAKPEFKLPPAAAARAAAALVEAARTRNLKPEGPLHDGQLEYWPLVVYGQDAAIADIIRLVGYWKADNLAAHIVARADSKTAPEATAAVWESLRLMGGPNAKSVALAYLGDKAPERGFTMFIQDQINPGTRRGALTALAALDPKEALKRLPAVLAEPASDTELVNFWREMLSVKAFADRFTANIPQGLPPQAAAAALRVAREQGKKAAPLVAALSAITGSKLDATPGNQNYADLVNLTKRDGSPAEGERVYRRAELGCVTCHAIGGAGGKVGPELTSMGASAPLDYIIESVLNPAAKVKEGYHAVNLTLKDGTVANGILARETAGDLILRNAIGQETAVAKGNVSGKEDIGSLMPAGLVNALPGREQLHLFAFLSELGKPGVYDASKGTVARQWKLLPGADLEKVIAGKADLSAAANAFTNVDGSLLKEPLQGAVQLVPNAGETVVAVARFQLPAAAQTKLTLTGVSKAWLNGKPLAVASEPLVALDLPAGEHVLAVKLDLKQLPPVIKAESADVRFLTE